MLATLTLLLPLGLSVQSPAAAAPAEAPVFALRDGPDGLALETLVVREGEPLELPCGGEEGWLDLVLPPGPGGSAGVVNARHGGVAGATLEEGRLQVTHRSEDGETWSGPALALEDLHALRVRISVTTWDGRCAAFVIRDWATGGPDDVGPVVDFFGGQVPLGEGDYQVATDTLRLRTGPPTAGACALEHDRHLFVKGMVPGGGEGWFLVDTGGAVTAVTRALLPPDHPIGEAHSVQYSRGRRSLLPYTPEGATGTMDTVVGLAALDELAFGDLRFAEVDVTVLSELPDLFGRPIVGILGLDLLRRAPRCRLELVPEGGRLTLLGTADDTAGHDAELPFTYIRDHLIVPIRVNTTEISAILDTGSPTVLLDTAAATAAGLEPVEGNDHDARGIDSGGTVQLCTAKSMQVVRLGDAVIAGPKIVYGPLPVFTTLHARDQLVGLLGNQVLASFASVELAFDEDRVLLRH